MAETHQEVLGGLTHPRLSPWGSRPVPLLPQWYRENLSDVPAPEPLRKLNPNIETLGQLDSFWDGQLDAVDEVVLRSLVEATRGRFPPEDLTVVSETRRSELVSYPFRVRTLNTLLRVGIQRGYGPLSVGDLLLLPNFGISSLVELMCLAESARRCPTCGRIAEWSLPDIAPEPAPTAAAWDEPWNHRKRAAELLASLFDAASEFHGASTVEEALKLDLHRLASHLEIPSDLAELPIQEITGCIRISDTLTDRLRSFRDTMSPREDRLIAQRLFREHPVTLESLAQSFGVSRERMRQIQERLKQKLDTEVGRELDILANVVRDELGAVNTLEELDRAVAEVLPNPNVGVFGAPADSSLAAELDLARRMLRSRLDYAQLNALCLNEAALRLVETMRGAASEVTDEAGLIDEEAMRDRLPSREWDGVFPRLMTACGFKAIQGHWAVRSSISARTKVALLQIGRPARKVEIAAVAGLDAVQVGGALARLDTIGRADSRRWGLKEWYEEEYEGIPTMIMQRIRQDGGATSLNRLLEDLPRKFGVSDKSVYSMVRAPRFQIEDGLVSLADESAIRLRRLRDIVHGRTTNGDPYWTFRVEDRYLRGYSLTGLPPEIACALGAAPPASSSTVAVVSPTMCGPLSVNWRLTSVSGGSLGRLSRPLAKLGVGDGDYVRLIIRSSDAVELVRDHSDGRLQAEAAPEDAS